MCCAPTAFANSSGARSRACSDAAPLPAPGARHAQARHGRYHRNLAVSRRRPLPGPHARRGAGAHPVIERIPELSSIAGVREVSAPAGRPPAWTSSACSGAIGTCARLHAGLHRLRRGHARRLAGNPALRDLAQEAVGVGVAGHVPAAGEQAVERSGHQRAVGDRDAGEHLRQAGRDADLVVEDPSLRPLRAGHGLTPTRRRLWRTPSCGALSIR